MSAAQSSNSIHSEIAVPYQDGKPHVHSLVVLGPSWFTQGTRVRAWARDLLTIGSLSVAVQFPGSNEPAGTPRWVNIDEQVNALLDGARIARAESQARGFSIKKVFYAGSSGGLTAAVYAAALDVDTAGIFGISPFTKLDSYRPLLHPRVRMALEGAYRTGVPVSLAAFDQRSQDALLDVRKSKPSFDRINLETIAPKIHIPVRIVYGLQDEIVDPASIRAFADNLPCTVKDGALVALDDQHELTKYTSELPRIFAEFINRTTRQRDVA